MRDEMRSVNPDAANYLDQKWAAGQQWHIYDPRRAEHSLLPDDYHSKDDEGRDVVKHIVIYLDGAERIGIVADMTNGIRHGKTLNEFRHPRQDLELAEYICHLHNDRLLLGA